MCEFDHNSKPTQSLAMDRFQDLSLVRKLKAYKCHGESWAADEEAIPKELPNLMAFITGYNPNDVFNTDEFGLFSKQAPNGKVHPKLFKEKKGKKTRVTYFKCTDIGGSEKHLPMVISR